jgi:hypothetical protein
MEFLSTWQEPLLWASALSVVAALGAIMAVPWLVIRLPADYFVRNERIVWQLNSGQSLLVLVVGTLKNLLGLVLVILGLVMLLTPGQGILTLLIGFMLMNFPGKYRIERWLALRPGVLRALNWLREKQGHPPFEEP